MRKLKGNARAKNSGLIKSFIELKDFREDYEVWVPYIHRGIVGFIDLVIESNEEISIFKFVDEAKKIENSVKSLKLERAIYPKARDASSKNIESYLVLSDSRKNRKIVLSKYSLLGNQPFEILFLNQEEGYVESISELKDMLPRIFQTKDMELDDGALKRLISKPNHTKIERAILNCDGSPKKITEDLIEKTDRYVKRNDKLPEEFTSIENPVEEKNESYQGRAENGSIERQNGVKEISD